MTDRIERVTQDHLLVLDKNGDLVPASHRHRLRAAKAAVYEDAACWSFAQDCIEQGFSYLNLAVEVGVEPLHLFKLSSHISLCLARETLNRFHDPEDAEAFYERDFLPRFLKHWPVELGKPLEPNLLSGYFYHNLAFLLDGTHPKGRRRYVQISVKRQPSFLLMPSTLRTLLWSK